MSARQPWSPDDYWRLRCITEMRLSPDGHHLAYTVEWSDTDANERRAAIWLLDTRSGATRQFTAGTRSDFSPCWSPDGAALAFISTRGDRESQLWVMPVAGGEPRQLTTLLHGAGAPFWAADGSWIGVEHEARPGEAAAEEAPADEATRARGEREDAERPRVITRLIYRWDSKGLLEGRTHLLRVPLAGGAIVPLTSGDYDAEEGACSPDGRLLAFLSDRTEHRDANMTTDLWLLDLASGALRCLTDARSDILRFAWSPDSRRIAYFAVPAVGAHSIGNATLRLVDVASGHISNLSASLDRSADLQFSSDLPTPRLGAPVWTADGSALYFLAQDGGEVHLLRAPATDASLGDSTTVLAGTRAHLRQLALAPDGSRLYVLQADATHPWDIREMSLGPGAARARWLTASNQGLLDERASITPETFTFASYDGQRIEAWLYRPVGWQAGDAAVPLLLSVHGGPHGAYGWSFLQVAQVLVGRGYALLQINPRGSAGYGETFMQACDGDWGGGDLRDLLAGLDAALARGGLDASRLAIMGVSYGAYITNWAITQTDRFRAAVSTYGIANLISMFGTADLDPVWAGGDYGWPWEREAFYRERSPLYLAHRVSTPLRIIAAEQDYRCPITQSEEWYTWLKLRGHAPVDFVRLPRASHMRFASPRQRLRRMALTLEWIEQYCPAR